MQIARSLAGLTVALGVVLTPLLAVAFSNGAPAQFAGNITRTDGTLQTCAVSGCHATFPLNSGTGGVAISAPTEAGADATVTVTVAVDNQTAPQGGRQGFEAAVRNPTTGAAWGTLTLTDDGDGLGDGRVVVDEQPAVRGVVRVEREPEHAGLVLRDGAVAEVEKDGRVRVAGTERQNLLGARGALFEHVHAV